jgi:hypothetical protein
MVKSIYFVTGIILCIGCNHGGFGSFDIEQNGYAVIDADGGDGGDGGDSGDTEDTDDTDDTGDIDTATDTPHEYWYLRCNSTSWNLDEISQMVDTDDANIKTLIFDVTEEWVVTGMDNCSITRTEQEGQWYPGLRFYSVIPDPIAVPGTSDLFLSFAQFAVDYPQLGTYQATLDLGGETLTIAPLSEGPSCSDGVQNGDESDIDCGGSRCNGCQDGKLCLVNGDCLSNACDDGICYTPVGACDETIAIDLGELGQDTTVSTNACVKVAAEYTNGWDTPPRNNKNNSGGGYPIPFAWENACSGNSGSGELTRDWQSTFLYNISADCATLINLQGNGADEITLRYYSL